MVMSTEECLARFNEKFPEFRKTELIVDFFKKCTLKNETILKDLFIVIDGENGIALDKTKNEVTVAKSKIALILHPDKWKQFADLYDDRFKKDNGMVEAKKLQAELLDILNQNIPNAKHILQMARGEVAQLPQVHAIIRANCEREKKVKEEQLQRELQPMRARTARIEAETAELIQRFEAQNAADEKRLQPTVLKLALGPKPAVASIVPPVSPVQFSAPSQNNGLDLGITSVRKNPFNSRHVQLIFRQGYSGNMEAAKRCEQELKKFGIQPISRVYDTVEISDTNYNLLLSNGVKNCKTL